MVKKGSTWCFSELGNNIDLPDASQLFKGDERCGAKLSHGHSLKCLVLGLLMQPVIPGANTWVVFANAPLLTSYLSRHWQQPHTHPTLPSVSPKINTPVPVPVQHPQGLMQEIWE